MGFTDMKAKKYTSTEFKALNFACRIGAMNGFANSSFQPDKPITYFVVDVTLSYIFLTNEQMGQRDYPIMQKTSYAKKHQSNEYLSRHDLKQIFDGLFNPIMVKPCSSTELHQVKSKFKSTSSATRLDLALLLHRYCTCFFKQLTQNDFSKKSIIEILTVWNKASIPPYTLIYNLYSSSCSDDYIRYPKCKDFFEILIYFHKKPPKNAVTSYENILSLQSELNESREVQKTDLIYHGYQYTSLPALYAMLTQSNVAKPSESPCIKMYMSNAIHLNDPLEGRLFDQKIRISEKTSGDFAENNNTYILSLSTQYEEQLPMWIHYANGGSGCRIEFEIEDLDFFPVAYLNHSSSHTTVQSIIDIFQNYLQKNWLPSTPEYLFLNDMYNQYRFYFKDGAYQYEKEIRLVLSQLPQFAKEYPVREGELFPRFYIETAAALRIQSVLLGPKCPNPEHVALFLQKMNVPQIIRSEIHYR